MPDQALTDIVSKETDFWTNRTRLVFPIDGARIPDFAEWVNWSGWKGYSPAHEGFDLAAYLTKDGKCVLGLPWKTEVRAVEDGIVHSVSYMYYEGEVVIHHEEDSARSVYFHVVPLVTPGQRVGKGDLIAHLWKDSRRKYEQKGYGLVVHLHFELAEVNESKVNFQNIDPARIFPSLCRAYRCEPQADPFFKIPALGPLEVKVANFRTIKVNGLTARASEVKLRSNGK